MLNPYLNSPSVARESEQDLLFDLTEENIQAGGLEITYIIKKDLNTDHILGESTLGDYSNSFNIEMLLENIQGFNGDGDLFNKFGLDANDTATMIVSTRRFEQEGQKFNLKKPLEGDILRMPLNDSIWEIRKVKQDENFYQFGMNYTWRLELSLFSYSHEDLPGIDETSFDAVKTDSGDSDNPILREILDVAMFDETKELQDSSVGFINFNPENPFDV